MDVALIVVAAAFALVNGANTGGTMLSLNLTVHALRPVTGILVMTLGVVLAPLLLGTAVADTVATDLVVWEGQGRRLGTMLAVVASVVVVWTLSRFGAPTGQTMALVGAMAGVGQAAGEPVGWGAVAKVLLMMALAPLIGAVIAAFLLRVVAPVVRVPDAGRGLRAAHAVAFALLSLAYGTNDAQKMLAVMAVATGVAGATVPVVWWQLLLVALFFGLGAAIGVGRMAGTIGSGILPVRTVDAVSTEIATATALLATSAAGAPVGLAQTISGALIGSGAARGLGRVRWRRAGKLVLAWVTTLPAAYALGAVAGAVVSRV